MLPWGRGVGKSEFLLLSMFLLVAAFKGQTRSTPDAEPVSGVRIVYLLPATTQAKKTVLGRFEGKLLGSFKFLGGKFNHNDMRADFPDGSWIQFVSQEQRELIRGLRCDASFVDEADDIDPEFYQAVASPWLSEPVSLKRSMLGGTPTRGRYGLLYQRFKWGVEGREGHYAKRATWQDAPEHVDRDYVARQRALAEESGTLATFLREWECDFDAAEGLVYPMFSEALHVKEPPSDAVWSEFLVGVDHGYEDAGVFLRIGIAGNGRDAIAWVLDEVYKNHEVEDWWVAKAKAVIKATKGRMRWYPDPSQPARIQALQRAGCHIAPVDNSIEDGVSAVANQLAVRTTADGKRYTKLYVAPQCKNLIREFSLYRRKRDPRNKDLILDDIQDKNNHAMDALRYAIFGRFGGPSGNRVDYGDEGFTFG